ncbi:hypothetical protein B0T24DRAFT_721271 [Lasiosphaeria ovina]|uniref:Uncharacterized protein n=1 Tax=Lasiosphaeria ovina TaxID=92902 RepID=A0AAE0K6T0_9PEZI|nr:hypothetical protein B0T24DRAFT_721271 [Lasiosphaeria ovina]
MRLPARILVAAAYALPWWYGGADARRVVAKPPRPPRAAPACVDSETIVDLWSVQGLSVAYTHDELVRQGNATFTLANTRTGYRETLRCALTFNSLCEFHGTPGDKDLQLWLQLNLELASITINQTWSCDISDGVNVTAFVVGMAEVYLVCPEDDSETDMTCHGDTDSEYNGYANGSVVLPAPPPPTSSTTTVNPGGIVRRAVGIRAHPRSRFHGKAADPRALDTRGKWETTTDRSSGSAAGVAKNPSAAAAILRGGLGGMAAYDAARRGWRSGKDNDDAKFGKQKQKQKQKVAKYDGKGVQQQQQHDHAVADAAQYGLGVSPPDLADKIQRAAAEEHRRCSPSCRGAAWSQRNARTTPVIPVFLEER